MATKIRTLTELHLLAEDEKNLIIRAIIQTSRGGHPYPDMETIDGFTIPFAIQTLEKYAQCIARRVNPDFELRERVVSLAIALRLELQNS